MNMEAELSTEAEALETLATGLAKLKDYYANQAERSDQMIDLMKKILYDLQTIKPLPEDETIDTVTPSVTTDSLFENTTMLVGDCHQDGVENLASTEPHIVSVSFRPNLIFGNKMKIDSEVRKGILSNDVFSKFLLLKNASMVDDVGSAKAASLCDLHNILYSCTLGVRLNAHVKIIYSLSTGKPPPLPPEITNKESLMVAQLDEMCHVMDLLSLRENYVRTLWIYYRRDVEKLFYDYVENGLASLDARVGLMVPDDLYSDTYMPSSVRCETCMEDDLPRSRASIMECIICFCDEVCWTKMIVGYRECGREEEALSVFTEMLKKYGVDTILEDFEFTELEEVWEYYPQDYHGFGKEGRSVDIERLGQAHPSMMIHITTIDRCFIYHVQEFERTLLEKFPACSIATKRQICSTTTIIDVQGLGMKNFSKTAATLLASIAKIDNEYYPETLPQMFIVNGGPGFKKMLWPAALKFLDLKTIAKIHVFEAKSSSKLWEVMDSYQFPIFLGGSSACPMDGGCLRGDKGPCRDPDIRKLVVNAGSPFARQNIWVCSGCQKYHFHIHSRFPNGKYIETTGDSRQYISETCSLQCSSCSTVSHATPIHEEIIITDAAAYYSHEENCNIDERVVEDNCRVLQSKSVPFDTNGFQVSLMSIIFNGTIEWRNGWGILKLILSFLIRLSGAIGGIHTLNHRSRNSDHPTNYGTGIFTENVNRVDFSRAPLKVFTNTNTVCADAVVVATVADAKRLNFYGSGYSKDRGFWNRGISACAVCGGAAHIFQNKPLDVIGGGVCAMEEANYLTKYGSKVYIIHRRDTFRAFVMRNPKIDVLWNSIVLEAYGDGEKGVLGGLKVKNLVTGAMSDLKVFGLFFSIVHEPSTKCLNGQLELDLDGMLVSVKRLKQEHSQGEELQFQTAFLIYLCTMNGPAFLARIISNVLMFSLPRPPEATDLEDKVNFKGGRMLRTHILANLWGYIVFSTFYSLQNIMQTGSRDEE